MNSTALDELCLLNLALAEGHISNEEHDTMCNMVLSTGKVTAPTSFPGRISHSGLVRFGNDNQQQ